MALFQKKMTAEEIVKAIRELPEDEREKVMNAFTAEDGDATEETTETTEETVTEETTAAENGVAETETETAEEPAPVPEATEEQPEATKPAAEQEAPAQPEEPAETTQDTIAEDNRDDIIQQLTQRLEAAEEKLEKFSAIADRLEEAERKNAQKFGYSGRPNAGEGEKSIDDMSADELKDKIQQKI